MNKEASLVSQAKQIAEFAAARELVRLNVDQSQPIDIFRIIERAGIWLLFQPLQDVQGVYLKEPETGRRAILINSRRPLSLQRLTAGHEYGHHVLGHEASLDEAADVEPSDNRVAQEAAAQTFANDFLMPPQLVNTQWRGLNFPSQQRHLEPHQVYLLSLYLGVSYRALIYQLVALKRVGWPTARRLAKYQPRQIKQFIGRGLGPLDSFADVWPLAQEDDGWQLKTRVNDEISVTLPETPSSGYRWAVAEPKLIDLSREMAEGMSKSAANALLSERVTPEARLALLGDDFEGTISRQDDRTGTGGHRYLSFRIIQAGSFALRLGLVRPWQPEAPPVRTFEVAIQSARQTTGDVDNGPREEVKRELAVSVSTGTGG